MLLAAGRCPWRGRARHIVLAMKLMAPGLSDKFRRTSACDFVLEILPAVLRGALIALSAVGSPCFRRKEETLVLGNSGSRVLHKWRGVTKVVTP